MRLAFAAIGHGTLTADVRAVWDDEASLWSREILDRLARSKPDVYGEMTVEELGSAMNAAGIPTAQIHRKINGQGFTRHGVRFDALGEPTQRQRGRGPVVYFVERQGFA